MMILRCRRSGVPGLDRAVVREVLVIFRRRHGRSRIQMALAANPALLEVRMAVRMRRTGKEAQAGRAAPVACKEGRAAQLDRVDKAVFTADRAGPAVLEDPEESLQVHRQSH